MNVIYGTIKRLVQDALIRESDGSPAPSPGQPHRRAYELTSLGRRVARLESRRLASLLDWAKASHLLGDSEAS